MKSNYFYGVVEHLTFASGLCQSIVQDVDCNVADKESDYTRWWKCLSDHLSMASEYWGF